MSAGAQSDNGQDFELNLAPIIDCFTVLITYMLVSTAFISLSILEVQTATTAEQPADQQPAEPQMSLSLALKEGNALEFKVSGREEASFIVQSGSGSWDLDRMTTQLGAIRKKWPTIQEVSVKADPVVRYKDIIKVVESLKKSMPKVFLGE